MEFITEWEKRQPHIYMGFVICLVGIILLVYGSYADFLIVRFASAIVIGVGLTLVGISLYPIIKVKAQLKNLRR